MQNVGTVENDCQIPFKPKRRTDLYIAKTAFKNTNQSHVVVLDLVEDQVMVEVTEETEVQIW